MAPKRKKIITYAAVGFLLGLFFPVVGAAVVMVDSGTKLSFFVLHDVYTAQPIMLVMIVAPIILSSSFALISLQSSRAQETSTLLNEKIKEREIRDQNESYFLEALINNSSFAVVRLDTNHQIITCNEAFTRLFGYPCQEIVGKHLDALIAPDEFLLEASQISNSVSSGKIARLVSKRKRKDGTLVDVEIVGVPVTAAGEQIGILGLYHDISLQKQTDQALIESEYRFKTLFDESPISLWEEDFSHVRNHLFNLGGPEVILERLSADDDLVRQCMGLVKILNVNRATINLYQAKTKTDLLTSLDTVLMEDSLNEFRDELTALIRGEKKFECEISQKKLNGEIFNGWFRFSVPVGYENTWERLYISIVDITDRKKGEEKLRYMSFHDALTGLYNRAYFEEELARLEGSRQYPVSLIACDLDGLKYINDKLGHSTGDQAIKSVAKILGSNTFRKEDVVARIGGDEFVMILPSVDLNQTKEVLERIEDKIVEFNNSSIEDNLYRPISLSLGFAVVQKDGSLLEGYKTADQAMYLNKQKKKGF